MKRFAQITLLISLSVLVLASCADAPALTRGPRWACPSPVPAPYGEAGPVKEYHPVGEPDPTTGVRDEQPVYYEQWEQEYGEGGSLLNGRAPYSAPPFPSPTPYGQQGNTYSFGQRVELAPLHVLVTARKGDLIEASHQVYLLDLTWTNPTGREYSIDYPAQLWLRAVQRGDGTLATGDAWGIDPQVAEQLGLAIPTAIAPGESRVVLPVTAPPGTPRTVELRFPAAFAVDAAPTTEAAVSVSPTPNTALRDPATRWLTVQWVNAAPAGPACNDSGALTDWTSDEQKAIPRDASLQLKAPPGSGRVVQIALDQVGKRYVWGATGPDAFDCSGLMFWSYGQIGIRIPRSTATQWPGMARVALSEIQPGDLIYMDTRDGFGGTPRTVTHVGMLADMDGDGTWDLIHAASPRLGVRVDYDVFSSAYYGSRIFGEGRTAR
jgi:cell wall-associated NlpC family hydrolase